MFYFKDTPVPGWIGLVYNHYLHAFCIFDHELSEFQDSLPYL